MKITTPCDYCGSVEVNVYAQIPGRELRATCGNCLAPLSYERKSEAAATVKAARAANRR